MIAAVSGYAVRTRAIRSRPEPPGHLQVGEQQLERLLGKDALGVGGILGGSALVARALEQAPDEAADLRLVVDDEDAFAHVGVPAHDATASSASRLSSTRRTVVISSPGVKGFWRKSAPDETMSTSAARSM